MLDSGGIHWVIVGGESGVGHRPGDPRWVLDLRDECVAADVPFFFKQWGRRKPKAGGRKREGREWTEMPTWGEVTGPLSPAIVGDAKFGAEKCLQSAE